MMAMILAACSLALRQGNTRSDTLQRTTDPLQGPFKSRPPLATDERGLGAILGLLEHARRIQSHSAMMTSSAFLHRPTPYAGRAAPENSKKNRRTEQNVGQGRTGWRRVPSRVGQETSRLRSAGHSLGGGREDKKAMISLSVAPFPFLFPPQSSFPHKPELHLQF